MEPKEFMASIRESWDRELRRLEMLPVGDKALVTLRAMARDDIRETMEHLKGSKPEVWYTWSSWYSEWIKDVTKQAMRDRPWLGQTEEQRQAVELKKVADWKWRSRVEPMANAIADDLAARNWSSPVHILKNRLKVSGRSGDTFKDAVHVLRIVGAVRYIKRPGSGHLTLLRSPSETRMALHKEDLARHIRV